MDFIFDRTTNGHSLETLVIIDEFTRERIALEISRKLSSDAFIEALLDLFAIRAVLNFFQSDNDAVFIALSVRAFL